MPATNGPSPTLPTAGSGWQMSPGGGEVRLQYQGADSAYTGTATITTDELSTGILSYTGAGHTLTLPTAALLDAAWSNAVVNSSFDFTITATTGTATLAVGTGITAGTGCRLTTAASTASRYRLRKTGTAAWTLYLLA